MKQLIIKIFGLIALWTNVSVAQSNFYAGIEIGSKALKVTILKVNNTAKADYEVVESWTDDTGLGVGIPLYGEIMEEDIENTVLKTHDNFQLILSKYNIEKENIFVVVASSVAIAKNIKTFIRRIEEFVPIKVGTISSEDEAKFLIRGSVPVKLYEKSVVFDIGGGNTKGGVVARLSEDGNYYFFPVMINYGTFSLTEKIKEKQKSKESLIEFLAIGNKYCDTIQELLHHDFKKLPFIKNRKTIHLSGGTVWAFVTLTKSKTTDKFVPLTIDEVKDYKNDLINNYSKFENLAKNNADAAKVLKTYSQKYLITGTNILLTILNNIESVASKKLYFVNEGHLAWLKAYVIDKKEHKD